MGREEEYFKKIWEESKKNLILGNIKPFEFIDEKLKELDYILTTVTILSDQQVYPQKKISEIMAEIMEVDSSHYFYPLNALHITLVGCTPRYKDRPLLTKEKIKKIEKICREVLAGTGLIEMEIRGVNILGSSMFFQVFPKDNKFSVLREELTEVLTHSGETPFLYQEISHIHINIAKLVHKNTKRLSKLVKKVEFLRNVKIGKFVVENIDLVISDRILSHSTIFIDKIHLL